MHLTSTRSRPGPNINGFRRLLLLEALVDFESNNPKFLMKSLHQARASHPRGRNSSCRQSEGAKQMLLLLLPDASDFSERTLTDRLKQSPCAARGRAGSSLVCTQAKPSAKMMLIAHHVIGRKLSADRSSGEGPTHVLNRSPSGLFVRCPEQFNHSFLAERSCSGW